MKTTLLFTVLLASSCVYLSAQTRFVDEDYSRYFDWHNEQSQVEKLFSPGSQLFVFGKNAKIHQYPDQYSKVLAYPQDGQMIINLSDYRRHLDIPDDTINGYQDIWYEVSTGKQGIKGYIWGGYLAKGWRWTDLSGDGNKELILLGVAPTPRRSYKDIKAEIRVLKKGHLLYNTIVPGLCVFEECGSSPMLRVLKNQPFQGAIVVEASTMTVGCFTGIERAFFYWNGRQLERVFHAEYTVDLEYERQTFKVQNPNTVKTMICNYKQQDQAFNPVWDCKELEINQEIKGQPSRARAR